MKTRLSLVPVALLFACGADATAPLDTQVDDASDTATSDTATHDTADSVEDTSPEVDTTPPEPWRHVGPISQGPRPEHSGPLFIERTADAIPAEIGLPEARGMVVDVDGDGRDDLVALGTTANMFPKFLRNTTVRGTTDWSFEDYTEQSGIDRSMVLLVFGDIDNDGDQDAFSGTSFRSGADGAHGFWRNDAGRFTFVGKSGLASHLVQTRLFKEMAAGTLADFDGDGLLDLYVAMTNLGDKDGGLYVPTNNELYAGDGAFGFTQRTLPNQHNPLTSQIDPDLRNVPRRSQGVCPADFDDDGKLDIFVNNYGSGRPSMDSEPVYWDWNLLWKNLGTLQFVDVGVEAKVAASERGIGGVQQEEPLVFNGKTYPGPIGGNGFGCSWGDFDNDGDLDLAVGQIAHPDYPQTDRLMLHTNPGGEPGAARVFGEESAERGLEYYEDELHPVLVDVDLDGRLDLAVSRLRGGSKWELYLQGADKMFEQQSQSDSGVDITTPGPTLWLDVDGDGDLDFFMPKGASGRLFENVIGRDASVGGNFLALRLIATAPRDATGARVTLTSSVGPQVRELVGGTGHYNTQQSRTQVFGLAGDSGASDVQIRWPDGEVQVLGDIKSNLTLEVVQGGAVTIVE
jgi:hypothetical protein